MLEGQVTRVLFQDEATLFAAVKVAPKGGGPEVSVIGEFLDVSAGDEFTFTGDWETHPRWGPQLRILSARRKLPRRPDAVVAYLGGGLFPGVGPAIARRVVRHFGQQTLDLILTNPERIVEVPGIGPKKRARFAAALSEHRDIQELALFLQGHGVTLGLTRKIHEAYGRQALEVVRTDPYRVAREIPGVGFLKADGIALKIGLPADSPARVRASVGYVLRTRCEVRGHSFLPHGDLVRECLVFLNREPGGHAFPRRPSPTRSTRSSRREASSPKRKRSISPRCTPRKSSWRGGSRVCCVRDSPPRRTWTGSWRRPRRRRECAIRSCSAGRSGPL